MKVSQSVQASDPAYQFWTSGFLLGEALKCFPCFLFPAYLICTAMTTEFTEPTTNYWQEILPPEHVSSPPWKYGVPARLPDSRVLMLPIRPLNNDTNDAIASLLVNQAALDVVQELGAFLAHVVKPFEPEVIIGLPTLGLSLAPIVAQKIGLSGFIVKPVGKDWSRVDISNRTIRPIGVFAQILVPG